jgi:MATE family multidrug resistance protein
MQDVKMPTLISLLAYWGIGLICSWFFGLKAGMGLAGIWLGLTLGLLSSSLLLIWRFYGQCKKMNRLSLKRHAAEL